MTAQADPVDVKSVSKVYRLGFWMSHRVTALNSLDLRIPEGQVCGLLGPNGAGKSTTIKILMNLVQPSSGSALVYGLPPSHREARRMIGFLPENPAPYEYLSGEEFLHLSGRMAGLSGHDLDLRVREVLGQVDMIRAAKLRIRRYSKGMLQRVCLAQALIGRPKLLILDEPTSGLDPVGRRQMRDLILAERERGTTILLCTHIIPDVEAACDRVIVLVGGKRVREGTVQELLSGQVPLVELTVQGTTAERVRQYGIPLESAQDLTDRVLLRARPEAADALMRKVLEGGGRVTQLQPARFSLEDLFLQALSESKISTVGGEIQ